MTGQSPQNPVYIVDATSLEACLPKVLCPECGTVIPLRSRRINHPLPCPSCHCRLQLHNEGADWHATVQESANS